MISKTDVADGDSLYLAIGNQQQNAESLIPFDLSSLNNDQDYGFTIAEDIYYLDIYQYTGDEASLVKEFEITEESFNAHANGEMTLQIVGSSPIEL